MKCGKKIYTLGAIVLNNMVEAGDLRIDGIPVGRMLLDERKNTPDPPGSIIMIVGTNAPMIPLSLRRIARVAGFGLARTSGIDLL